PGSIPALWPRGTDVRCKLAGIDSMSSADVWRGAELAVPRAQAAVLPQGRHYVFEVVGLRVITESGLEVGTVREIIRTGSNDVYIVQGGDREYLIPAISSVVLSIEPAAGRMVIRPFAGLLV